MTLVDTIPGVHPDRRAVWVCSSNRPEGKRPRMTRVVGGRRLCHLKDPESAHGGDSHSASALPPSEAFDERQKSWSWIRAVVVSGVKGERHSRLVVY